MMHQLRFTGVGGQGVLLAGEILAEAQIKDKGYGVKAATYTSQVRGGPTKVDILLSDEEILYPYANEGGIIVVEPNLVRPSEEDRKKFKIYEIPIITIAKEEVGNVVTQSVVALAITTTFTQCVDRNLVFETMIAKVPAKVQEANKKAFELGEKYAKVAKEKA